MSEPFNPLDKMTLAKSVERALMDGDCSPLPPVAFDGAGLYVIFYGGSYPLYAPISAPDCGGIPIYVGKADPPGGSAGGFLDSSPGRVLHRRVREHADSIRAHQEWGELNKQLHLKLEDFSCRYLVVEDIWIPLGEAILISNYQPVWNLVVKGFGKHPSGAGRTSGRRSLWDELHPGRPWALREQTAQSTKEEIEAIVTAHLSREAKDATDPDEEELDEVIAQVMSEDEEIET